MKRMLVPPRVAIAAAVLGAQVPLAAGCHASTLITRRLTGRGASVRFTLASAERSLGDLGSPRLPGPPLGAVASSAIDDLAGTGGAQGDGADSVFEGGGGVHGGVEDDWKRWSRAEQAARRGERAEAELDLRTAWKSFAAASALSSPRMDAGPGEGAVSASAPESPRREEARWYFRAAAAKNACDYAYAIYDALTERHLREVFTPTRGEDTHEFAAKLARGAFKAALELVAGDDNGVGGQRGALGRATLALCAGRLVVLAESGREKLRMAGLMRELCEEAVRLDPDCDFALYMLGRWHNDVAGIPGVLKVVARMVYGVSLKGSLEEGRAYCERAAGLRPRVYSHYELARSLLEMGDAERALAHLKRAAGMDFDCINGYLYQRAAADGLELAAQAAAAGEGGAVGGFSLGRPQYTQREGGGDDPLAPALA